MRCRCPECLATLFQPVVQVTKRGKAGNGLPEPVASILDVLLDLPLLPARCWIAKLGLEQVVAGHCLEADVDIPLLAATDLVYGGPHIVIDAAPWNATEHAEGMVVGVEQHLVGLQEIGADDEGLGIAELGMRDLQLGAFIANDCPILGPVELEGFSRFKAQRNEGATSCRLHLPVQVCLPFPCKGRNTVVGPVIAEADQVSMQLLHRALLLAGLLRLRPQPRGEPIRKRIELAWPLRKLELWLNAVEAQVFADGVPGQARPSGDLADR